MSFEAIWCARNQAMSASFTLERSEGTAAAVACRVVAQQKGSSAQRQLIRINSDFPYNPVTASPAHIAPKTSTGRYRLNLDSTVLDLKETSI